MRHAFGAEEEHADLRAPSRPTMLASFHQHLRSLETPPKNATVAVLRLWFDLHHEQSHDSK
jgi:hypothetical protein